MKYIRIIKILRLVIGLASIPLGFYALYRSSISDIGLWAISWGAFGCAALTISIGTLAQYVFVGKGRWKAIGDLFQGLADGVSMSFIGSAMLLAFVGVVMGAGMQLIYGVFTLFRAEDVWFPLRFGGKLLLTALTLAVLGSAKLVDIYFKEDYPDVKFPQINDGAEAVGGALAGTLFLIWFAAGTLICCE